MNIIGIDIGNTTVCVGIFKNNKLVKTDYIPTNKTMEKWEIKKKLSTLLLPASPVTGIIISSVVPELTDKFKTAAFQVTANVVIVNTKLKLSVKIKKSHLKQLGSDIIAGSVGAVAFYDTPLIVIDLGTATTFTVIIKNKIISVLISPGLEISKNALTKSASLLPEISLNGDVDMIGNNTISAIRSGTILFHAKAIDGVILMFEKKMNIKLKIILTGGLAFFISPFVNKDCIINQHLVLNGLNQIYHMNYQ